MRDALLLIFVIACLIAAMRYPFVGILTWAWFALLTPHQMAYGVYGLPLNVIIAGATLTSIGLSGEWRRFRLDRITALLIAFAFWLSISQIFSIEPKNSALYFDRFIKLLVFVILVAQTANDRLRFHTLVWMMVICMGYFAAKGALFTLLTLGQFHVQGLENTILEDNNHMGIALATTLPLILFLLGESKHRIVRAGLAILFALTIVAILGTQSRGAFVALVVFAGFFWLRSKRKLSILAGLSLILVPAIIFMPSKWYERMGTIAAASEDASFMGRVDAWVINTKLALAHPITGAGLRNSYQPDIAAQVDPERAESAKAAHSVYFEVLGGAGFVGLMIYLSLLASAFLAARSLHSRHRAPTADSSAARFGYFAQIALIVFCVGGATVSLEMWDGYLLIIALIAALTKVEKAGVAKNDQKTAQTSWRIKARGGSVRPSDRSESSTA